MLTNVNQSLMPLPGQPADQELRIFQVLPKTTHIANEPRIGYANAESARMLLGTVPVEADGSAYFRAPPASPSISRPSTIAAGPSRPCAASPTSSPASAGAASAATKAPAHAASPRQTLAMRRPPSRIAPGPDGTAPLQLPAPGPARARPQLRPLPRRHSRRRQEPARPDRRSTSPRARSRRSYDNLRPFCPLVGVGRQEHQRHRHPPRPERRRLPAASRRSSTMPTTPRSKLQR